MADPHIRLIGWSGKIIMGQLAEDDYQIHDNFSEGKSLKLRHPCFVDFELNTPSTGSSTISWKLTPFLWADLVNNTNDTQNIWTFPGGQWVYNGVAYGQINSTLISAYKEICNIKS